MAFFWRKNDVLVKQIIKNNYKQRERKKVLKNRYAFFFNILNASHTKGFEKFENLRYLNTFFNKVLVLV